MIMLWPGKVVKQEPDKPHGIILLDGFYLAVCGCCLCEPIGPYYIYNYYSLPLLSSENHTSVLPGKHSEISGLTLSLS